jgi:glycosyltransferase involved in cell wall biosynthesis
MKTICFIIATKDRPDDLRTMLHSLADQSVRPGGVIIVDGSDDPVKAVVDEFVTALPLNYIQHRPPSASGQRNVGIQAISHGADLVGFLDDDATLEPGALERMISFWERAPADVGGCAFNMINHPAMQASALKKMRLAEMLGLYSPKPGIVTPSGWQTMLGQVRNTTCVDWLPSGAVVWRANIFNTHSFDDFFTGYSYLEDLDFSFTVRRRWRLAVVADARYGHYPSPIRHSDGFRFGRTEIRNRLYFVRKHGLSVPRCWLGMVCRLGITIGNALAHLDSDAARRAIGNMAGMTNELRYGA